MESKLRIDTVGYHKYGEAAAAVVTTYHGKILCVAGKRWYSMDALLSES
jgi:hypothetical protein